MGAEERALVSVVMPVYNSAEFLRASVSSALAQSWGNIELICVDDGSTDESLAMLREFQRGDDRIKIIAFPFNRGVSAARNEAIDNATGSYVSFFDSDDSLPPDAVERLVAAASGSGCELAIGQLQWLKEPPSSSPPPRNPKGPVRPDVTTAAESAYLQSVPEHHGCNLYARELLERHRIRYDTDLSLGEDQVFQVTAFLKAGKVALIEDIVYVYHHYRLTSLTRKPPELKSLLDEIEFHRRIARLFKVHGIPEAGIGYVSAWSYSISEYWLQIPRCLSREHAYAFFRSFREMTREFAIAPWNQSTPAHHQHLLSLVVAGHDSEALDFLATDQARDPLRGAATR